MRLVTNANCGGRKIGSRWAIILSGPVSAVCCRREALASADAVSASRSGCDERLLHRCSRLMKSPHCVQVPTGLLELIPDLPILQRRLARRQLVFTARPILLRPAFMVVRAQSI